MTRGRASQDALVEERPDEAPPPAEEPAADAPPTQDAQEADPETELTLLYRGQADVFEHGTLRIRPGQPVTVPSDVAEELLTFPHELFEVVASQE